MSKRFGIVGNPVEHSKSPDIHKAAYQVLNLDWDYSRNEISKGGLTSFIGALSSDWQGLSVTAPLKNEAYKFAASTDNFSKLTAATNTLIRNSDGGWDGYNTDIFGMIKAIRTKDSREISAALIIGSGSTALSAIVAVATIAPKAKIRIFARNAKARKSAIQLGRRMGLKTSRARFFESAAASSDLVISSVPAHSMDQIAEKLDKRHLFKPGGILLDVTYAPWPSKIASLWQKSGNPVIGGIEMLIWQAIAQLRLFVNQNVEKELVNEIAVRQAMRIATRVD